MRLLVTTDAVGGIWDHSVTLTRHLVRRGHEVTLALLGPDPRARERLGEVPEAVRRAFLPVPLEWMPGGLEAAGRAAEWIDALAAEVAADVVHLTQLTYAPLLSRPALMSVHGDAWSWHAEVRGAPPSDMRWLAYRRAVRRAMEVADLVVAPSRYQAALTRAAYGRGADRVVWNGIDPDLRARALHRPARSIWRGRAPERRPVLATVGRAWDEAKGFHVLEEALGRLGDGWTVCLAGETEGPEGQRFRSRRIHALGRLPKARVWELLRHADVYVGCSLYEPFGLAMAEAALAGCALVLSDIGSFREVWDDSALFFRKGDPRALAESLEVLARDPELAHRLAERGQRRAERYLGAGRMASEYAGIYRRLKDGRGEGAEAPARRQGPDKRGNEEATCA